MAAKPCGRHLTMKRRDVLKTGLLGAVALAMPRVCEYH